MAAAEHAGRNAPDPAADAASLDAAVRAVLADTLALSPARVAAFTDATPLFGALPELDSMAVAGLLTELEDRIGIVIDDDEVDGEMMATLGSLLAFVRAKATPRTRGVIGTYDSGCGIEHVRIEGAELPVRVLILPALFDEANRMRRTTVMLMHRLLSLDVGSILPDLPGTGESQVELARVTWRDWTRAVEALRPLLAPGLPLTIAIRAGALLDQRATDVTGARRAWRLSPETGARVLRDLDRTRRIGNGSGYAIGDGLRRDLEDKVPFAPEPSEDSQQEPSAGSASGTGDRVRTVRLTGDPAPADLHIAGARLWRQAEPGEDAALVDALARDIAEWAHACAV